MFYLDIKKKLKFYYLLIELSMFSLPVLVFSPLAIKHLDLSFSKYLVCSYILWLAGFYFLDKIFTFEYHSHGKDEEQITVRQWFTMMFSCALAYLVIATAAFIVKVNFFLFIYIFIFLTTASWVHFNCLRSHTKHYNDKYRNIKIAGKNIED